MIIAEPRTSKLSLPECPTPPVENGYVVNPNQVPIGAQPAPTRRLTADATGLGHRALADAVEECIFRCGTAGLSVPYYAAMSGDDCYCASAEYVRGRHVCALSVLYFHSRG